MRILVAVSLVFATPAIAADFRGTEFGSTCDAVTEREAALGSEQLSISGNKVVAYRFKGRAFDRMAQVTYLCKDGALALVDLRFHLDTYEEAVATYLAVYEFHESAYGAPFVAYVFDDKKSVDFELPAVGAEIYDSYHAAWKGQGLHTRADLIARHDHAGGKSLVSIVATAAGE